MHFRSNLLLILLLTISLSISLSRRFKMLSKLSLILGDIETFIINIKVKAPKSLPLSNYEMDHICYRCSSKELYKEKLKQLNEFGDSLVEGMIGGRPITILKLYEPIECQGYQIHQLEIPCPKVGSYYEDGLEHAEFVIGNINDDPHDNRLLQEMIKEYPDIKFDTRAIDKDINADISLKIDDTTSIKFHVRPINEIVEYEKKHNIVIPVPANYF